jgi:hypothetical protein
MVPSDSDRMIDERFVPFNDHRGQATTCQRVKQTPGCSSLLSIAFIIPLVSNMKLLGEIVSVLAEAVRSIFGLINSYDFTITGSRGFCRGSCALLMLVILSTGL